MKVLFADRLRDLRVERGLNQSGLAREIGVTQRKVSYWETGAVEPDLATLCRLAEYFSVSTDFLLGFKDY